MKSRMSKSQIEFRSPGPDRILHHYELDILIPLTTYCFIGLKLRFKASFLFFFPFLLFVIKLISQVSLLTHLFLDFIFA
jgi:hypothetical protein